MAYVAEQARAVERALESCCRRNGTPRHHPPGHALQRPGRRQAAAGRAGRGGVPRPRAGEEGRCRWPRRWR